MHLVLSRFLQHACSILFLHIQKSNFVSCKSITKLILHYISQSSKKNFVVTQSLECFIERASKYILPSVPVTQFPFKITRKKRVNNSVTSAKLRYLFRSRINCPGKQIRSNFLRSFGKKSLSRKIPRFLAYSKVLIMFLFDRLARSVLHLDVDWRKGKREQRIFQHVPCRYVHGSYSESHMLGCQATRTE